MSLPIVPDGAVVIRHEDPKGGEPIHVMRDTATGEPLCWRCRRALADEQETTGRPTGRVDVETYGHRVVVCPGCLLENPTL